MSARLVFALALGVALVPGWCIGQNLVPNPSFEDYDTCPDWLSQIDRATGWQAFRLTPDYMNACDPTDTMSVPLNLFGSQQASEGVGYAGMVNYSSSTPNTREFLGTEINEPLMIGVPVYVSFKAALGAFSGTSYRMQWTTNNVGMRFSMGSQFLNSGALPNASAIHMEDVLTDTAIWYHVSGSYLPDSAYQYVMLGNFYDDPSTVVELIDPNGTTPYSYTYVDEVCVSFSPFECGISSSAMNDSMDGFAISVWPNPFSNTLHVSISNFDGIASAALMNALGQKFYTWNGMLSERVLTLNTTGLPEGAYHLQVRARDGAMYRATLIHLTP